LHVGYQGHANFPAWEPNNGLGSGAPTVLFLSEAEAGQINERELRKIARQWRWDIQLEMFQALLDSASAANIGSSVK
jgi:hypothetical protein